MSVWPARTRNIPSHPCSQSSCEERKKKQRAFRPAATSPATPSPCDETPTPAPEMFLLGTPETSSSPTYVKKM